MKLSTTKTHDITFTVEYFQGTEGGMDSEQYGEEMATIQEAVALLELAQIARKDEDWVIVARVKTSIK